MTKYILYVERIDKVNCSFHTQYSIPLDGCYEEENAIMLAKKDKSDVKRQLRCSHIKNKRGTCWLLWLNKTSL